MCIQVYMLKVCVARSASGLVERFAARVATILLLPRHARNMCDSGAHVHHACIVRAQSMYPSVRRTDSRAQRLLCLLAVHHVCQRCLHVCNIHGRLLVEVILVIRLRM